MSLQQQLRGTGVALVTPFSHDGAIDFDALKRVIEHVITNGCEYVVTLGTTGETPVLSRDEKLRLIEFTFEVVNNRVPVVVGVGGNFTGALVKDLASFPLQHAAAVLSASPYYNKPSQEGIYQHYKALAEASPKPVLLYNVPGRTGRGIAPATALQLAHEVPNIAGIKEASGDMVLCMQLLRQKPEGFLVVSGDDNLAMPQIACGMDGVISVVANCFPRAFSDLVRLSLDYRLREAKQLNDVLLEAYDLLFCENNPAGVKAFLAEMGLIQNHLRLPLVPLSEAVHAKVKAYLAAQ
ncbi:MAG TPA: 4-hydroxy-tetrahydrodipicolinate synthase [Lacibacter sp.]|nr:4-hydroxy-tetrahydrodipicolinate synthase [Lacibacter sp.]HMO89533.1 4-hydroxy-tetrahydrodipicolinate synthase [Lacibacter sp.]HMP88171.1 4-hydroxy-tetrahydrodipicolinate synthase [Lacibacter sp.]